MTATIAAKTALLAGTLSLTAVFADVDFKSTVTLGSLLVGVVVAAIAALATIRSRVSSIWREEAAGWREKAERMQDELTAKQEEMTLFAAEQAELRHRLKSDVAGLEARLEVEQAKHDLGKLFEKMEALHAQTRDAMSQAQMAAMASVGAAVEQLGVRLDVAQRDQRMLLEQIRDALKETQRRENR